MTTPAESVETAILENTRADLEAEGFEVRLHPSKQILPAFLQGYQPDAIALRGDRNLVIEVTGESGSQQKIDRLKKLIPADGRWDFRIIYVPSTRQPTLRKVSVQTIQHSIEDIRRLAQEGMFGAGLIMCWATFEALGRFLRGSDFQRPQTPGRLVEVLASEGDLLPTQADELRLLVSKRNSLIHGELETAITREDLAKFIAILEQLTLLATT